MGFFDEEFLENLSSDPMISIFDITEKYIKHHKYSTLQDELETFALVEVIILENKMDFEIPALPENRGDKLDIIYEFIEFLFNNTKEYVQKNEDSRNLDKYRKDFSVKVAKGFAYEFSQGDLDRIQVLLDEMRTLVVNSSLIEENHKRRLLKRLERLQGELQKKQSDLDHFRGLVGDAGVALGKFGKDAKPFTDRIREITSIVWRTQSRAEELPSGTKPPLLSGGENDEENDS
ncbi:MAG: hypothetical protein E2O43_08580 [Nitrospina sp.]|nr:MAG: hypothetical protein E2O43_08580 [Nitrospina sp.]